MNVGFIGVGYMGYGIAKNILKKGNNLFVIANKKRAPIDKIVSDGAKEVKSYNELCEKNSLRWNKFLQIKELIISSVL